jgi:hypothetical protein
MTATSVPVGKPTDWILRGFGGSGLLAIWCAASHAVSFDHRI